MLECINIVKKIDTGKKFLLKNTIIADNISLKVNKGEIFTILGESGAGKTTFLRMIAGFANPDSGEIIINDNTVFNSKKSNTPDNRSVGIVFQNTSLFPHMTVLQNIEFVISDYSKAQKKLIIDNIIVKLSIGHLLYKLPSQLSGGEQQKIIIARILCKDISVLLLDEPFSNLDRSYREEMREELKSIVKTNNLISILVTHDYEEAFAVSDKIAILKDGVFLQCDTPESIYNYPNCEYTAKTFGKTNTINTSTLNAFELVKLASMLDVKAESIANSTIVVRPKDIELYLEGSDSVISKKIFYGDYNLATINIFGVDLHCKLCECNEAYTAKVGDAVALRIKRFLKV